MKPPKSDSISIPNLITGFRLLLIPLFVLAYFEERYGWALACLAVSGLSDIADGYIARHFDMVTDLGKLMDPVADKLTQGAMMFCVACRLPAMWYLFGFLAVKEIVMALWGWIALRRTGEVNSAKWYGKVCTFVLYASMAVLVLLRNRLPAWGVPAIVTACGAVMLMSLVLYSRWYILYLRRHAGTAPQPAAERGMDPNVSICLTALIIVVLLVCVVMAVVYRREITLERILSFTPRNLWVAALVFMGLFAAKSLTSIVYVKLLYAAAGVVFPLPVAIAVSLAGTAVELAIPYGIGLGGGRGTADLVLKRWPRLNRLKLLRSRSNFWFAAFTRAVGVLPADPVSLYFGACRMPFGAFLLGSLAGMLPTLLITVVIGAEADDPDSPGFITATALFVAVQLISLIIFSLWIKHHSAAISAAEKEVDHRESAE